MGRGQPRRGRKGPGGAGAQGAPRGESGVGVCNLPGDPGRRRAFEQLIDQTVVAEGQKVLWWRDVPVDDRYVGGTARLSGPVIRQVLLGAGEEREDQGAFERKPSLIPRVVERAAGTEISLPSFSSRTIVYK